MTESVHADVGVFTAMATLLDPPHTSPETAFARIGWQPQPKQALAEHLAGQVAELLYGGAAGGGKSAWLLAHGVSEALRHPGNRAVIFRRVMPSLTRTLIPRSKELLHGHGTYNGKDNTWTFPNGSVLEFGHLEHDESVHRYQGAEYGFIGFEEVTEFLESQWEFMRTRVRAPVAGVVAHMAATTNPGGVGHRWVKRRWVRPTPEDVESGSSDPAPGVIWEAKAPEEGEPPVRRVFIPATLEDNPRLTQRDPAYRATLRAIRSRSLRRAMELGDWDAIDQIEGAYWSYSNLEANRKPVGWERGHVPGGMVRCVVGVDPAVSQKPGSDETGIVVAGKGTDGRYYVLADRSCSMSPEGWAKRAVQAYRDFNADRIVAERNNGGDMVEHTIRTVDPVVAVKTVWASRGKAIRAEPVAALYEQGKVSHIGAFGELESQLTSWTPEDGDSPDRLDALVWCLTELAVLETGTTVVEYRQWAGR